MSPHGGNRGAARPFLEEVARRDWSVDQIQRWLRDAGLGYRRTELLDDVREIRQLKKAANVYKYVRKDYIPSPSSIGKTSKHLSTPFMYTAKVWSRDSRTGLESFRWRSMKLIKLRTAGALERRFAKGAKDDVEKYGADYVGISDARIEQREISTYGWESDDAPW